MNVQPDTLVRGKEADQPLKYLTNNIIQSVCLRLASGAE